MFLEKHGRKPLGKFMAEFCHAIPTMPITVCNYSGFSHNWFPTVNTLLGINYILIWDSFTSKHTALQAFL
jgi:hypothetical protein